MGINTAIIAQAQGIGFAVPSATAQWVLGEVLTQGRVRRAYLGISGRDRPLDRRLVRALDLPLMRAVEVMSRDAEGPAAQSDLRPGDLVVAVNTVAVDGIDALYRYVSRLPARHAGDARRGSTDAASEDRADTARAQLRKKGPLLAEQPLRQSSQEEPVPSSLSASNSPAYSHRPSM